MPSALSELLAAIVPPACAACRRPLRVAGAHVCGACLSRLPWLGAASCRRCALPDPGGDPCPARAAPYTAAWAPMAYDGVARDLVHALKFGGSVALAELLGAQVAAYLPP